MVTDTPPGLYGALSVADEHVCAVTLAGELVCWGANDAGQTDVPTSALTWDRVFSGPDYSCGRDVQTGWRCWGSVSDTLPYYDAVVGGENFYCGSYSVVTECSLFDKSQPDLVGVTDTPYTPGSFMQALTAGDHHVCGLRDSSTGLCWGLGSRGTNRPHLISVRAPYPIPSFRTRSSALALGGIWNAWSTPAMAPR